MNTIEQYRKHFNFGIVINLRHIMTYADMLILYYYVFHNILPS